ncbi:MAG: C25 family cysteine peptidase [Gemmataceae bacterium]
MIAWPESARACPLWDADLPRPERVVACPPSPRPLLLQAALLAALERAPLWIEGEGADLSRHLRRTGAREATLIGDSPLSLPKGIKRRRLQNVQAVAAACRRSLKADLGVADAVVSNPADLARGPSSLSALAPWLAATKRAALLLTDEAGRDVQALVEGVATERLDGLVLLGDLQAIPTWQRPNPIPDDKDKVIDLEPLTPTAASGQPVSYAVGRLFHEDRAVVPLMLARQRLAARPGPRRALVASNPGGGLPLLEAFSRTTALELGNAGYEVTERYGDELNGRVLRKQLPRHDVVLWEGHHNTLVKEWGFLSWDEPLPASFVFLQSCLALMPEKVQPLLSRGALGVVGTSTRTYSASGGAFSLAYFDALLYEGQSAGGALRQAKNFLLAYAALKEKRLGAAAKRTGANHRAAWAFSLWGDPTYHLPRPGGRPKLPPVRHKVEGGEIVLSVPEETHPRVSSERYRAQMTPNGRLAGLVRVGDAREVVPLVFAEVRLPAARPDRAPRLKSRLPGRSFVFRWDGRRKAGWLLATPRPDDQGEMRFRVDWPGVRVAEKMTR